MANTIRTSELPLEEGIPTGEELVEVSAINTENNISTFASKKANLSNIGSWIFNHMPFFNLLTNNKTIVGAINEIKNSSGSIAAEPNAGAHNAIYRGECLGTAPTAAQYAAIDNGSFDDMFIGDYWYDPNEGIHWRIAGFNYYQGTGSTNIHRVLTNHVIIIPDECIIGDSYIDLNNISHPTTITELGHGGVGEYTFSLARGYKSTVETFTIDKTPSGMGTDCNFEIQLQHEVGSTLIAIINCNIEDSNGVSHPSVVQWSGTVNQNDMSKVTFNARYTGRSYSGSIVTYYQRNQYNVLFTESDIDPFRLVSPSDEHYILYFPIGTEVTIYYTYLDENLGCLNKAKDIIKTKFGSGHIMKRYTSTTTYQGQEIIANLHEVDLPTSEMIFGHSAITAPNGEYNQYEASEMNAASGWPTLVTSDSYYGYISLKGHYNEGGYVGSTGGGTISYDVNRLPLFFYNPSLIHNGYGYWLKNMYSYSNVVDNFGFHLNEFKTRYCLIDASGIQTVDLAYNQRLNTGIRPVFCLAATNEPYVNEEE